MFCSLKEPIRGLEQKDFDHVLYASMCTFIIFYYVCHFGAHTHKKKSLKCAALNAAAVLTDCTTTYYVTALVV